MDSRLFGSEPDANGILVKFQMKTKRDGKKKESNLERWNGRSQVVGRVRMFSSTGQGHSWEKCDLLSQEAVLEAFSVLFSEEGRVRCPTSECSDLALEKNFFSRYSWGKKLRARVHVAFYFVKPTLSLCPLNAYKQLIKNVSLSFKNF